MDTSDPDIEFDDSGICNHCKNYETRARRELHLGTEGAKKLERLIKKVKQKGKIESMIA